MKKIKLAYIGGGSKQWARVFMTDLALTSDLTGEIALYDIDIPAAERNKRIGERINGNEKTVSVWKYKVCQTLGEALEGADFVVISILPGTFDEMETDVHLPEKYGIYQSVGDTAGPGGVLRAMRTVPLYEGFAKAVREHCPDAWVINFTNPMSICVKTLYDVFPGIKAFGCCHEVFHAQEFLCCVYAEMTGSSRPERKEMRTDAVGINHFTWISRAHCRGENVMDMLPGFIERYYEKGYCEMPGVKPGDYALSPFYYGNKVKMELFRRYGALGAAGDRHLAEFFESGRFLNGKDGAEKWLFHLTSVEYRKAERERLIREGEETANGKREISLKHSDEEAVSIMKALLGEGDLVTNVNLPNRGQVSWLNEGDITETDCLISCDGIRPIAGDRLPESVRKIIAGCSSNINACYKGIKERDIGKIYASFINQPLCSGLSFEEGRELFDLMVKGTRKYLDPFYDID